MRRLHESAPILKTLALLAALGATGCDPEFVRLLAGGDKPKAKVVPIETPIRVCTAELRILTARLVDATGAPVIGATVSVRRELDAWKTVEQYDFPQAGQYTIFTDGTLPLSESGTPVTVRFALGGKEHAETYLLASDGCHFHVIGRPDTPITTDF